MANPNPLRVAVVLSHPTQYYSPWFRWIQSHAAITLRVFYLWDFGVTNQKDRQFHTQFQWDVDLLSGYESEFIPNTSSDPGTHHFRGLQNPTVTRQIELWAPDAVWLFGYNWESHWRVIWWARRRRIPLLFRGDSHLLGRRRLSLPKRLFLGFAYAQFSAFLPVGLANREYFTALGVRESKLFFAPHAVDVALYDRTNPQHVETSARLRAELGLSDDSRVILFAGKLVPAKQPFELLEAFLRQNKPGTSLVFVGDGPEKARLVERARAAAPGSVHFLPFANQSEMPSRYLLADVFALPSRGLYETWGLAVNEAMHMGVPALVSNRVGCQRDLVTDGVTGWVFDVEVQEGLDHALGRALDAAQDRSRYEQIRRQAVGRIAGYTYAQATAGLTAALGHLFPNRA